jgi:hypothetical protein
VPKSRGSKASCSRKHKFRITEVSETTITAGRGRGGFRRWW